MQLLEGGLQPNSNSATRAIGYRQGLESLLQWQADPASLTPSSMVGLKVNNKKSDSMTSCVGTNVSIPFEAARMGPWVAASCKVAWLHNSIC